MEDDQPTCGKGLAANAILPEKLGTLMRALADLLDNHTRSLDRGDPNARLEIEAYAHLVQEQRAIAAYLQGLTETMRGYRDLPMGAHDENVLGDQRSLDVLAAFIRAEEELLALLQEHIKEHRSMLDETRSSA